MKSDRVSVTPNQIPPTDEIMPDLNHSGIYNTQNSQKTLCMRIYILHRVVQECQITNKVNKKDKESDTSLWRSQAKFILNDPKQTEPNKTKTRCRHDAHQNMCDL